MFIYPNNFFLLHLTLLINIKHNAYVSMHFIYIHTQSLPREYDQFNSFDKAKIRSHNYRCSVYHIRFDLYYKEFKTTPKIT